MATSYLEGHFLDSTDPEQVICSGPFQSHKRYKLAMLPSTVAGGAGQERGIDLVFNIEAEPGARDYQVFQKINNWTDGRLSGFKIEIGTGVGTDFIPSGAEGGVGVANLSLSVPGDIWSASQLATLVEPFPALIFSSQDASVAITSTATFEAGAVLTARIGDADLNLLSDTAETVEVQISTTTGLSDTLVLEEQGENRGVFSGILPSEYSAVPVGTTVTVTYTDENIGDGSSLVKTATTTAADPTEPPMPTYDVSIADFSTPASLFVGQSGKVSLTVVSDKASEAAVSGEVVISADGAVVLREPFTDLAPNRRFRTSTTWTADVEGEVSWTAAVVIDEVSVDTATSTTSVTVKPGNKNNVGNR